MKLNGIAVALLLISALDAREALAEWPALGRPISTADGIQFLPRIASDGANGAVIVWRDLHNPRVSIFARRVLGSGELDPRWPVDGRALLSDTTGLATAAFGQAEPVIAPDGSGGAIVAWEDGRVDPDRPDIYAQHVLASGALDPAWPANGRALSTAPGAQRVPDIVADGAGGAIVVWTDDLGTDAADGDIFAQHVLASGEVDPRWPVNGLALTRAPRAQLVPHIVADGLGGGIVSWADLRSTATGLDIYAQHVLGSGTIDPRWPVDGRALCLAPGEQASPAITSDGVAIGGAGSGAIVSWQDPRQTTPHIFAQRVLISGQIAPGWAVNGLDVCTAPLGQGDPKPIPDGAGGAIVTWLDARDGVNAHPFAQHVLAGGTVDPAWPVAGRAISLSSGFAFSSSIVSDGRAGAIVAWEEDSFIHAHHVLANGLLDAAFPFNGRVVRPVATSQHHPDLVATGDGNAIVTWDERNPPPASDIYAQLVQVGGTLGVSPGAGARVTFSPPRPNPAGGPVHVAYSLPRAAEVRLAVFDVNGRLVRRLVAGAQPAGPYDVTWDARTDRGEPVAPGLHWLRLEVDGQAFTRKVVTTK